MADTDNSSPILRYNLITQGVEYFQGSDFYPIAVASPSGVSSLNTLTGAVTISAGSNITLTPSGNNIAIASTGSGINQLTGDVTAGPGTGSQIATLSNPAVTGQPITGFVSGAGTVSATDTILTAIDKLDGNIAATTVIANAALPETGGTMTGSIVLGKSLTYPLTTKASADSPITVDSSNFTNVLIDVDGALTINGPTNGQQGRKITFVLEQDVTGHAVTFATGSGNFRFGTDIPSFTASGASKTDYVGAVWNADVSSWDIVAVIQGF